MDARYCSYCNPRTTPTKRPSVRRRGDLTVECGSDDLLIVRDRLDSGWRVGKRTGCYIGACTFEWRGAFSIARLSVFPVPSQPKLAFPPPVVGHYSGGSGITWILEESQVIGMIRLRCDDSWNPELRPKALEPNVFRLFNSTIVQCDPFPMRIQLNIGVNLNGPKPALVWREWFGTISGGLPSLGKQR
jgi:hypothetical protein